MLRYHAAEQLALNQLLQPDDNEATTVQTWRDAYAVKHRRSPETAEVEAATAVLRQRLGGEAPPLPPSTSGAWPRLPGLLYTLTDGGDE